MDEKLLLEAGLTQNEVRVYLTLLRIGKSQSGKIVRESGISGGKVYETLYKLHDKGLVELVVENNVKQFFASDPQSLLMYMEEKKNTIVAQTQKLAEVIPDLQKLRASNVQEDNVSFVKDLHGIRPVVYNALENAQGTVKIMGIRSSKDEVFNIFWQGWHARRIECKKKAHIIFSDKGTEYWKKLNKLKYTTVRCTPSLSPSAIMVIDNQTFIFSYDDGFTCVHIASTAIARSFTSFFDNLWEHAEQ